MSDIFRTELKRKNFNSIKNELNASRTPTVFRSDGTKAKNAVISNARTTGRNYLPWEMAERRGARRTQTTCCSHEQQPRNDAARERSKTSPGITLKT